jgi:hypothetical protein
VHNLGRGAHEIHVEIGFDRVNALERLPRLLDTAGVRQREVWIARNGAPEMRPRLGVFRRREAVRVPQAALIRFPGAEALGRMPVGPYRDWQSGA